MSERTVVLMGDLADDSGEVAEAVRRADATPLCLERWEGTDALVDIKRDLMAIVFASSFRGFEELCLAIRSEPELQDLAVMAVTESPWGEELARLFMFSIDDYVTADNVAALEPKLLAVAKGNPWADIKLEAGRVVVADPDRGRRVFYGRMLRKKGFDVGFAIDGAEVRRVAAADSRVRIILADADLPGKGAFEALKAARAEGERVASLPWIVVGDVDALESEAAANGEAGGLRLFDRRDPPENVLFLVTELLNPPPANVRRSPRLLYGAPATFKIAGGDLPEVAGFTYNINRTGVFIRTLVPAPHGTEVAVDMRPPFGEGRSRVHGKVVWRRQYSDETGPVVPAGMGVVYTRVPLADGAALGAGYDAMLKAAPGKCSIAPPPPPDEK